MRYIIIINKLKDFETRIDGLDIVEAKSYLSDPLYSEMRNVRVYNLCRSYSYQSTGYYVSLLAEARGHKAIPSVTTLQDLKSQTLVRVISDDVDRLIQQSFSRLKSENFELCLYFGNNVSKRYDKLSRQLYNLFQAPLMRAKFNFNKKWNLQYITPIPLTEIPDHHKLVMIDIAKTYFSRKRLRLAKLPKFNYDLAILNDPISKQPPSNPKAIRKFIDCAESLGMRTELITKDDYSQIPEFDALFIRETTFVNHYTYRFARRAHAEGLVVIDDPQSIVRCTNKVYMAELFSLNDIPIPKTMIVQKDNQKMVEETLGLPCVLKQPDSSFSQGVIKVSDPVKLKDELERMLDDSDLICAQEFVPTPFDWRVGILNRKPLYVCKYFMARGHWMIYNYGKLKQDRVGDAETIPIEEAPKKVVKTALKAANLIGNGLYGVDLKEINGKVYVIEVNDNPSIDYGIEDRILKDELYRTIMLHFLYQIEHKKNGR